MDYFRNSDSAETRSKSIKIIYLALLLVCTSLSTAAGAQNPSAQSNQSSTNTPLPANVPPPSSPTAIPISEVVTQAESASATLKEIASGAASDPATEAVERRLPALTEEINARLEETAQVIEGATSLDTLRTFEADWRTLTKDLPAWTSDLRARARKLEGDLKRLDDLSAQWQKTHEELRAAGAPPEVLARIEVILQTGAEARSQIEAEQKRVVALQNRVAGEQNRVDDALNSIRGTRESLVGRLLVRDSPPIWSADLWTRGGISQAVRDSLQAQLGGLNAFGIRNRDKLIIHILIFAALAGILFYLRGRARPLVEANPDLRSSAVIFYLPVSTALVLAILFNSRIYPQTPQMLGAIFGAIALVPTVIILRKVVEAPHYPLLYSLVVFFFIDQLRVIVDAIPNVVRPLFLVEMLAGFLFFLWFYRTRFAGDGNGDGVSERRYPVVRIATLAVLPFFSVAFLANAFGYVNLSRLVGNGVLNSAYAAIVLYAVVRIVDGLIAFALRFRPLNLLTMVRNHASMIQRKMQKFIRWIAAWLWLVVTLEFFTLREPFFSRIKALLTTEVNVGSLNISAGDVLLFFVLVWAAFLLSRFIRFALEEDVYPRFSLAHGIPYAVSTILNYVILLVGFFFAVGAAGFDLTRFTVLVGAFGVGIGFGLQNIFNNFVSGLILLFERPVKIGDEIRIQDATGTVRRIGIRASVIRQWDNSEIIVPNSKLISENVKNWTRSTRSKRGVEVLVSVAQGTDTGIVTELLKGVAAAHPLVAEKPEPQVLLSDVGAATLNFKLRAWATEFNKTTQISSELAMAISRALAEKEIAVSQGDPNPSPE
ncbi:MAG TPA: mechanosensitive ion channel domain-containing protein [Pyrinomonadaceae bacterium]